MPDGGTAGPIRYKRNEDHVVVTLDRPGQRNAITRDMVAALHEVCADLEQNPAVALFCGNGPDFAAGADIAELRERRAADALSGINSRLFDRISRLPLPTIALIHGNTLGGGAELAYACDFRLGTHDLRVGNPEPGLGILAAAGATWRLRELVGLPLARKILLTGHILDADEAERSGLVDEVVDSAGLNEAGLELAQRIARQSGAAIRLTKTVLMAPSGSHPMVDELAQAILFETDEKEERMTTFLRKGDK